MEPLFLDSPMHEKIWGGNRLKTEFGYDIPSEQTGEYWAISANPNGVSYVKNGKYAGFHLAELYKDKPELFGNPKTSVFPLLTKILDANDWLSVQVHPDDAYGIEHEGDEEEQAWQQKQIARYRLPPHERAAHAVVGLEHRVDPPLRIM